MLKNDRLLCALSRKKVDATPIWIMRQAGRYLPEYRELRARSKNFLTLLKEPELACEVTLLPVKRFPLDAAILFSDILTIPDAMGLGLNFTQNNGPQFNKKIQTSDDIQALSAPDPDIELGYVMDTIRLVKKELDGQLPLIGFSGSPWTLATYMVEGGSSKQFSQIKALMYESPTQMHALLKVLSEAVTLYLNAQIEAGVDAIMIFDSWGGVLTTETYQQFSLDYMRQIITQLNKVKKDVRIPIILFTKGGGHWVQEIAKTGCDAIGIDWTIDLGKVRQAVGGQVALQGNLDPAVLYGTEATIRKEVDRMLASYGAGTGHVFNLGHGIHPQTDPEKVSVLIDAVHESSRQYHESHTE